MQPAGRISLRFRVSGHVQGVGFRAYTQRVAEGFGLDGWVANTRDGEVEGEVQGNEEHVQAFLDALRKGPPASRVRDLSQDRFDAENRFEGFEVRRTR